MDQPVSSENYLQDIVTIYKFSESKDDWGVFWKAFHSNRLSTQEADFNEFINQQCSLIAKSLSELGKENPSSKNFLSALPLRYSKTILSWPKPTSEEIKEIMSD